MSALKTTGLVLSTVIAAGALSACIPSINSSLEQADGNAPLVIDLDAPGQTPLVISTNNNEILATVRGPNKGAGERGGITGSFVGPGGVVCVVMDPANKWEDPSYPGNPTDGADDCDADLFVGLAANYTGTPGVNIGDFTANYVDALGVAHAQDQNLCIQGDLFGLPGGHAGAGTVEYCPIDTVAGATYIVKAESIAAAPKNHLLKVAMRVGPASLCSSVTEDTLVKDNQ